MNSLWSPQLANMVEHNITMALSNTQKKSHPSRVVAAAVLWYMRLRVAETFVTTRKMCTHSQAAPVALPHPPRQDRTAH